jgi:Zn-finger nucleic acid-binding protein
VALVLLEFKEIEVDYCTRCCGVWLDAGELEELIERTGAHTGDPLVEFSEAPAERRSAHNRCPRCDRRLGVIRKTCPSGNELRLDRCPRGHGLWFDSQELKQLMESFPSECGAGKTLEYLTEVLGAN